MTEQQLIGDLHQLSVETFEIEDVPYLDIMAPQDTSAFSYQKEATASLSSCSTSCSSCCSCSTSSCCSTSTSTSSCS